MHMKVYEISLRFVKSFLIDRDNELILVDSGTKGSGNRIISAINSLGKSFSQIKYIIFTHSHPDHIGGAYEIKSVIPTAQVGIDEKGVEYLKYGRIRYPIFHSMMLEILFTIGKPILFKRFNGIPVDFSIKEGELIKGVEILKTPGHTEDSISIYLPEINSMIVGDTLQGSREGLKYPNIYEDFEGLKKSVEKIKSYNPSMVYVSHGYNSSKFLV